MNEHTSTLLVMLLVEFHSRECPLSFQDHMEFIVYNYPTIPLLYVYIYIQGVPGGMDKTSGECSLC